MADEIRKAQRAVAQNVLAQRRAQKLSREEAAWKAEIDVRQWGRVEGGKSNPTLRTLVKIAVAMGVEVAALFAPVPR
jgi:transcriptional regulator with XRE-family HTH domain